MANKEPAGFEGDTTGQRPWVGVQLVWFEVALAVIALLSVLPAQIPALAINTRLGWWLYVGTVILVAGGILLAHDRKEKVWQWEQMQRDASTKAAAEQRHRTDLARQREQATMILAKQTEESDRVIEFFREAIATRAFVAERGIGRPLLDAIDVSEAHVFADRQRYVAAIMAMQGHGGSISGVAGGTSTASGTLRDLGPFVDNELPEAVHLLKEIRENPPTTPEAVQAAAKQLKAYVVGTVLETDAALPITPIKSGQAKSDAELLPEMRAELETPTLKITPSTPDSEEPPPPGAAS